MAGADSIMTVLGPVSAVDLGATMMHEHVLVDMDWPGLWPATCPTPELINRPVEMELLGLLRRDPFCVRDNLRLTDLALAVEELGAFKAAGGGVIVEATTIGIHRNPEGLREISRQTQVPIIAGCGWYIGRSHPPYVRDASITDLMQILFTDLTEGMDGTDVRAGIIGELGTDGPIRPEEEKVLKAGSRVHHETGVAISVHLSSWCGGTEVPKIMRIFREENVDPRHVVLGHMCMNIDADIRRAAAGEGFNIEFDTFGYENYYMWQKGSYTNMWHDPRDTDRIEFIVDLVDRGHLEQIVISQDIYTKHNLKRYGGWGYDHILTNIVPMMQRRGLSERVIDTILVQNPARILGGKPHVHAGRGENRGSDGCAR